MIFVTVGTQDKQFKRLLEEVERLIKNGKIIDTVIAQIGNTKFTTDLDSKYMHLIEFTTPREVEALIQNAELIITHGGVATIIEGLNMNKKIIAVPRLKKYKEHVNDHQLQIIENFNNSGYIIGTTGVEGIEEALEKAQDFVPKTYVSNNEKFVQKLENCII
ncbi:MAG: beta(1,3)galactosyltransferase EpsH [Clostridia bacterium]|nr:beta(1,3)galactosyltransferase EpsH [Clostridia bacterium]